MKLINKDRKSIMNVNGLVFQVFKFLFELFRQFFFFSNGIWNIQGFFFANPYYFLLFHFLMCTYVQRQCAENVDNMNYYVINNKRILIPYNKKGFIFLKITKNYLSHWRHIDKFILKNVVTINSIIP